MIDKLQFYGFERLIGHHGIILNGHCYLLHSSRIPNSGVLKVEGKVLGSLSYEGRLENICHCDSVCNALNINEFKAKAVERAFQTLMDIEMSKDQSLLLFHVFSDVLPALMEFDSRIATTPRSELLELRKREFLGMISESTSKRRLTRQMVRRSISDLLKKEQAEQAEADQDFEERTGIDRHLELSDSFDFNPNLLIYEKPGFRHDEVKPVIYELEPRKFVGNVEVVDKRGNRRLFRKRGEITPEEYVKKYQGFRTQNYLNEAARTLNAKRVDEFIEFCSRLKGNVKLSETDICHENSGIHFFPYAFPGERDYGEDRKHQCLYVYIKPPPYAMRSLTDPNLYYPFENPPEVGVFLKYSDLGVEVSKIQVNGDFLFVNHEFRLGHPQTFCGPLDYKPTSTRPWTENVVDYIMIDGVGTLQNGMSPGSHHRNIEGMTPITEAEVGRRGLIKTNIHDLTETRGVQQ
ncbi:MAG: hypothetical protein PHF67_00675 [Candidatus Nanoarchaeia archaeon]|nr:hypothetical protein [Candidatus Nanoarchaeia archaeon]